MNVPVRYEIFINDAARRREEGEPVCRGIWGESVFPGLAENLALTRSRE